MQYFKYIGLFSQNKGFMKTKTWAIFVILGLVWGCNPYFTQMALPYLSPIELVWWRILCGMVPLLIIAIISKAISWQHLRYAHHFFIMSLLATSLYYILYAYGTKLMPSGIAGVLSASIPLFTFISSMIFLRQENVSRAAMLGMAWASAGIVFIAEPWKAEGGINMLGVVAILGGSLLIGLSFVYARKYLAPLKIKPIALSAYQMVFAFISLLLTTPTANLGNVFQSTHATIALILGLGVMGTGIAYLAYYYLIETMGAVLASTSTYLPPVVALIMGYIFAGETINVMQGIGILILLMGVACIQFGDALWRKWRPKSVAHNTASCNK